MWNVIFGGLAALGVAMIIDAEARRLQTEWSLGAWRN